MRSSLEVPVRAAARALAKRMIDRSSVMKMASDWLSDTRVRTLPWVSNLWARAWNCAAALAARRELP